jgi:hypothetical protein
MSPISEEYRLVLSLKQKLLAIRDSANGSVSAYLAHPSLFALNLFVKQINKDLNDIRDTFTIIGQLLHGNTTDRITTALVEMTMYSFHIFSQREKFGWIDREPIKPDDVDTIITSLRNIAILADTYTLTGTGIDNLAQSIERRDNPRAFNLSRSSSRSSSSSSSSRSSSRSSRSSSSSSQRSSPSSPRTPPPPRQSVRPLDLTALSTPTNRLPPPPLVRQNAQIDLQETPLSLSRLSSSSLLDLSDARGKKYRKIKSKRRKIKATYRKPLVTNNSRKHRRAKTSTKKNN